MRYAAILAAVLLLPFLAVPAEAGMVYCIKTASATTITVPGATYHLRASGIANEGEAGLFRESNGMAGLQKMMMAYDTSECLGVSADTVVAYQDL